MNTPMPVGSVLNHSKRRRGGKPTHDVVDTVVEDMVPSDTPKATKIRVTDEARRYLRLKPKRYTDNVTIIAPCVACGRTGMISGKSRICVGLSEKTNRLGMGRFEPRSKRCQMIALDKVLRAKQTEELRVKREALRNNPKRKVKI